MRPGGNDRHAAPAGPALVLAQAHAVRSARGDARAALASGTARVGRLYHGAGDVPQMVALCVLRELDLLLGLAIGEAAHARGLAQDPGRSPARTRLEALGIMSTSDDEALRRLDARRRRLARRSRAASAGQAAAERAVARAVLANAGDLYGRLSRRLDAA